MTSNSFISWKRGGTDLTDSRFKQVTWKAIPKRYNQEIMTVNPFKSNKPGVHLPIIGVCHYDLNLFGMSGSVIVYN